MAVLLKSAPFFTGKMSHLLATTQTNLEDELILIRQGLEDLNTKLASAKSLEELERIYKVDLSKLSLRSILLFKLTDIFQAEETISLNEFLDRCKKIFEQNFKGKKKKNRSHDFACSINYRLRKVIDETMKESCKFDDTRWVFTLDGIICSLDHNLNRTIFQYASEFENSQNVGIMVNIDYR